MTSWGPVQQSARALPGPFLESSSPTPVAECAATPEADPDLQPLCTRQRLCFLAPILALVLGYLVLQYTSSGLTDERESTGLKGLGTVAALEEALESCCRLEDCCRAQSKCDSRSQHMYARLPSGRLPTHSEVCDHVKLISAELSALKRMAKDGLVFVGDSTALRMYVRTLVHLEAIKEQAIAEALQNRITLLTPEAQVKLLQLGLTDAANGMVFTRYTGIGEYDVRYLEVHDTSVAWIKKLHESDAENVYYGVPFLHALYNPQFGNTELCQPDFDMRQAVRTVLSTLQETAVQLDISALVATSNTYFSFEDATNSKAIQHPDQASGQPGNRCESCWHEARCEEFSQTIAGMAAANNMLAAAIAQFDKLQLVRMDSVTEGQSVDQYIGGGHYKGPVLDQKLHAMLATRINND